MQILIVDIGDDHNMNVNLVEQAITAKTRAIIPVHLNGRLCDMAGLMALAAKYRLAVIEDSAQALGASYEGKRGGVFGLAGCFSFYPAKMLGALGDGGAVVTSEEGIVTQLRQLRDHGRTTDGDVAGWSFNCRLDNLQAAILDLKLQRLPGWIVRRREIAGLYHLLLHDLEEVCLPPPPDSNGRHFDVYQYYEIEAQDRDKLVSHLKKSGIEIMIPWGGKGVHQLPALGLSHFHLPRTDQLLKHALLLPLTNELSNDQVEFVAETVRKFYGR